MKNRIYFLLLLIQLLFIPIIAQGMIDLGPRKGDVMLLDGSQPMEEDLDLGGFNIVNGGAAAEVDPLSWHINGDNSPSATMSAGFQNLEDVKEFEMDRGTGTAYRIRQIYGIAMAFQPKTGDGAFIHAMPSDDSATKNVGFVINRRAGVNASGDATGTAIDVLNFFFIPGRNAYVMETKAFFGGGLFDLWIDHAGDGNPEWIFKVNGETSAENNPITNIGSLEIDPGSGTPYTINQLAIIGANELHFKSGNFDAILSIASEFDDGLSPSKLRIYRLGSEFTDKEYLDIGLLASGGDFLISSQKEGTGTVRSIGIDSTGNGTADAIFQTGGNLSLETHKLVNLVDGTDPQDGVTKSQLDAVAGGGVFGTEYETAASLSLSTTSGAYVNKLSKTTASLSAGDYFVAYAADVGSTMGSGRTSVKLEVDDTTIICESFDITPQGTAEGMISIGCFGVVTLTAATHTLDVDFRADSSTAKISNARVIIYKVEN